MVWSLQEKSKLSLAEVYEQEYLKQQGKAEEAGKAVSVLDRETAENPKEVDEIRKVKTNCLKDRYETGI